MNKARLWLAGILALLLFGLSIKRGWAVLIFLVLVFAIAVVSKRVQPVIGVLVVLVMLIPPFLYLAPQQVSPIYRMLYLGFIALPLTFLAYGP
jgi:hypothetical protein